MDAEKRASFLVPGGEHLARLEEELVSSIRMEKVDGRQETTGGGLRQVWLGSRWYLVNDFNKK